MINDIIIIILLFVIAISPAIGIYAVTMIGSYLFNRRIKKDLMRRVIK